MLPLANFIIVNRISYHSDAVETQLYITMLPDHFKPIQTVSQGSATFLIVPSKMSSKVKVPLQLYINNKFINAPYQYLHTKCIDSVMMEKLYRAIFLDIYFQKNYFYPQKTTP